jgi:hypothetical protein
MFSLTVPTPPLETLRRFCAEHKIAPTAVFQLSWALVLHCYFDTCTFLLDQEHELRDDSRDARVLVNFVPELASKTMAVAALQLSDKQESEQNTVLHHSSAKNYDSTLQKLWSRLRVVDGTDDESSDEEDSEGGEPDVKGGRNVSLLGRILFGGTYLFSQFDISVVIELHGSIPKVYLW